MILHRRMQTVSKGIPGARSLHLDRDVGQKTPTCILTHRQASQGPRAQDSPGARTKGPATPRQPGLPTQPPPVLEHIEPGSIRPMVPVPHSINQSHGDDACPSRSPERWHLGAGDAGLQGSAGWSPSCTFSRILLQVPSFPASLLALCVVLCCFCVLPCSIAICCLVCFCLVASLCWCPVPAIVSGVPRTTKPEG